MFKTTKLRQYETWEGFFTLRGSKMQYNLAQYQREQCACDIYRTLWRGSSRWIFRTGFPASRCTFRHLTFPRGRCTLTSCCVWRQRWRAGWRPMGVRWSPTWPAGRETRCRVAPLSPFRLLSASATRGSAPLKMREQLQRNTRETNLLPTILSLYSTINTTLWRNVFVW